MNFVKLFEQSEVITFTKCSTEEELQKLLRARGIETETVATLMTQLCRFATLNQFNVQQQQKFLNLAVNLLQSFEETSTKQQFYNALSRGIDNLHSRDSSYQTYFTMTQIAAVREFLLQKVLPFYELYQIVLDNHPLFKLEAQTSDRVKITREAMLQSGTAVDVQGVPALQAFLGVRAPKEEKKDAKKK